jgi:hypothetical protein
MGNAVATTPASSPAARVARQSFAQEDQAGMQRLNVATWKSARGAGSVMPVPQRHIMARELPAAALGRAKGA